MLELDNETRSMLYQIHTLLYWLQNHNQEIHEKHRVSMDVRLQLAKEFYVIMDLLDEMTVRLTQLTK